MYSDFFVALVWLFETGRLNIGGDLRNVQKVSKFTVIFHTSADTKC